MEPLQLSEDKPSNRISKVNQDTGLVKEIFGRILRYWYWFVISVGFCVGVSKLYLRYAIPVYNIESRFLLKKQNNTGAQGELMSQLEGADNGNDVQNEIEVLLTKFLMKRVVHDLQLNVSIFSHGSIKLTEIYKAAPFEIHLISINDSLTAQSWKVTQDAKTQYPILSGADGDRVVPWGDTVILKNASFTVMPNPAFRFPTDGGYYVLTLSPEDETAIDYLGGVSAAPVADGVNIIKMTIADPIPKRGEEVLNDLYDVYVKANIEDQSTLADNTITFIDSRLAIVQQELSGVEQHIEQFKSSNKLVDITQQSSLVTTNANDLEKQIAQLDAQLEILNAIEDQLNKKDFRVVPASLVTQSVAYSSLVEKFNQFILQRDGLLETSKANNPVVLELNDRIESVRTDLRTELDNIKEEMVINRNSLAQRLGQITGEIRNIPSKQRAFLDISRQQEVKQQLYLFLLQKREETAISKSGTLSNSRLIDPARADGIPFSPNRRNIFLIGLFIGLALPAGLIYLTEFLNSKIRERRDISARTNTPILGEIGHNKSGDGMVVKNEARSIIAEQFRSIRTNLRYLLTGKQHQVILVTSSMSGEGKSFISLNLASSLAISGKKVVLLELDLRKPRLSSQLGLLNDQGFSNYIISNTDLKYLPKPAPNQPNLYIISSGPIPPNPSELLLQDKVKVLFEYLYANFDYIVIDTPPVGLVSDALLVSGYADTCLYVTRQNYTFRQQIAIVDDLFENKKMNGLSIIINDVDASSRYGYGYGYRYGDSSYYMDDKKRKGIWKRYFTGNGGKS